MTKGLIDNIWNKLESFYREKVEQKELSPEDIMASSQGVLHGFWDDEEIVGEIRELLEKTYQQRLIEFVSSVGREVIDHKEEIVQGMVLSSMAMFLGYVAQSSPDDSVPVTALNQENHDLATTSSSLLLTSTFLTALMASVGKSPSGFAANVATVLFLNLMNVADGKKTEENLESDVVRINQLIAESKYGEALEIMEKQEYLFAENPFLRVQLAEIYLLNGQISHAIINFEMANKSAPNGHYPAISYKLADLYLRSGKYDEAERVLKILLKYDEHKIYANHQLGGIFYRKWIADPSNKDIFRQTKLYSQEAFELDPNNLVIKFDLGLILHNSDAATENEKGVSHILEVVRDLNNDLYRPQKQGIFYHHRLYYDVAMLLAQDYSAKLTGRDLVVETFLDNAMLHDPNNALYKTKTAEHCIRLAARFNYEGNLEFTEKYFKKAIENGLTKEGHMGLALVYLKNRKIEDSIHHFGEYFRNIFQYSNAQDKDTARLLAIGGVVLLNGIRVVIKLNGWIRDHQQFMANRRNPITDEENIKKWADALISFINTPHEEGYDDKMQKALALLSDEEFKKFMSDVQNLKFNVNDEQIMKGLSKEEDKEMVRDFGVALMSLLEPERMGTLVNLGKSKDARVNVEEQNQVIPMLTKILMMSGFIKPELTEILMAVKELRAKGKELPSGIIENPTTIQGVVEKGSQPDKQIF